MDHPSRPLVSVIIPAYNAEKTIHQAIESVLNQGIASCEILVIDDGSTDRTAAVVSELFSDNRLHILRHPEGMNRGGCASRHLALAQAKGEFVAFLDADDYYLPGKLEKHLRLLQEKPDLVLVHSAVKWSGPRGQHAGLDQAFSMGEKPFLYDLKTMPNFLRTNCICNSTVVCRREAIDVTNLPDYMSYQYQDWLLWTLLSFRGKFFYDSTPFTVYAFHETSFTFLHARQPGAGDLASIEFYLTLIPRLPSFGLRLFSAKMLMYRMLDLLETRLEPPRHLSLAADGSSVKSFRQVVAARLFFLAALMSLCEIHLRSLSLLRKLVRLVRRRSV